MVVPPKHPKMIIFGRKTRVVGYHHFRKHPCVYQKKTAGAQPESSRESLAFSKQIAHTIHVWYVLDSFGWLL